MVSTAFTTVKTAGAARLYGLFMRILGFLGAVSLGIVLNVTANKIGPPWDLGLLRWGWLCILLYLTYLLLSVPRIQYLAQRTHRYLQNSSGVKVVISYLVVALLGASLAVSYWFVVGRVIPGESRPSGSTHDNLRDRTLVLARDIREAVAERSAAYPDPVLMNPRPSNLTPSRINEWNKNASSFLRWKFSERLKKVHHDLEKVNHSSDRLDQFMKLEEMLENANRISHAPNDARFPIPMAQPFESMTMVADQLTKMAEQLK